MGRGILKRKHTIKKMFLGYWQKECERLQAENKMLKEDPTSVVGKFLNDFHEVVNQNQRLSTLTCALLQQGGGKVKVTRDEIEVFRGKRLRVNIETTEEGVKFEDATAYIFGFTAVTKEEEEAEKAAAAQAAGVPPTEGTPSEPAPIPECTDPNCALPKDLKHTHPILVPPGELTLTQTVPDADEPQSGLLGRVPATEIPVCDYCSQNNHMLCPREYANASADTCPCLSLEHKSNRPVEAS